MRKHQPPSLICLDEARPATLTDPVVFLDIHRAVPRDLRPPAPSGMYATSCQVSTSSGEAFLLPQCRDGPHAQREAQGEHGNASPSF
jgi:hypothetical protein